MDDNTTSDPGTDSGPAYDPAQKIYDQIDNLYQQHLGRKATTQESRQWGSNIDSRYMNSISNTLYGTDEAKAYRARAATPPADTTTKTTTGGGGGGNSSSPVTSTGLIPAPSAPPPASVTGRPTGIAPPRGNYITQAPDSAYYHAPTLQRYNTIDQSAPTGAQNALLMQLLQHPESMTAQGVAQLKEQQKEAQLSMQSQNLAQMGQSAASRGTWGGGTMQSQEELGREASQKNILDAYRGIDIQKMQQDQVDKLNALQAGDTVMGGQMNRSIAAGNFGLQQQLSQEGLNQAAAESAHNNWLPYNQMALQQGLTQEGYGLDYANLGEKGRQFDLTYADQAKQWRSNLMYNYANLDQSSQEALMRILFGQQT